MDTASDKWESLGFREINFDNHWGCHDQEKDTGNRGTALDGGKKSVVDNWVHVLHPATQSVDNHPHRDTCDLFAPKDWPKHMGALEKAMVKPVKLNFNQPSGHSKKSCIVALFLRLLSRQHQNFVNFCSLTSPEQLKEQRHPDQHTWIKHFLSPKFLLRIMHIMHMVFHHVNVRLMVETKSLVICKPKHKECKAKMIANEVLPCPLPGQDGTEDLMLSMPWNAHT